MREQRSNYSWTFFYGLLLAAFTVYVLLDTFVITRVYTVVPTEIDSNQSEMQKGEQSGDNESEIEYNTKNESSGVGDYTPAQRGDVPISSSTDMGKSNEAVTTKSSYNDDSISITIKEYREYGTSIYVAEVYLSSAEYLKTAFAQNSFGRNITEKTSEIARSNNAVLAINGDYYGAQEYGYVLRNGNLYRESAANNQEDLVIWQDGSFEIITEGKISAQRLYKEGAEQILTFGPALLADGEISVTKNDEVGKAKTSNPRTAIGIIDELHYVFVVSDGRTEASEGLTLYQLAEFMQSLGVDVGYNLDGGGSSTMYFNGKIINNPTTGGNRIKERSVSDIVYIG